MALGFTTRAAAQSVEGRTQLGLTTPIFSYSDVTTTNEDTDTDAEVSQTSWGIRQEVALELGYGLSDLIVLGVFANIGGTSQTMKVDGVDDEQEASELEVAIGPKLDLVLAPGSGARPFIGAIVALATTSRESDGGPEVSMTGAQIHGRVGVHWFASEGFTLSPSLDLSYATLSGDVESDDGTDSVDVSSSGISFMVLVGVAGWL